MAILVVLFIVAYLMIFFLCAALHYLSKAGPLWELKSRRGFLYDYEEEVYQENFKWCVVHMVLFLLCGIVLLLPMI